MIEKYLKIEVLQYVFGGAVLLNRMTPSILHYRISLSFNVISSPGSYQAQRALTNT